MNAQMPHPTRPRLDLTTTCACGAVHVSLRGPAYAMLLCSCLDCQKSSGTGHSAVSFVNAEDFEITGATSSYSRSADSGAVFTRHFCPNCGTPVFGQSSRAPRFAMVPVGLFAGQSEWFRPNQLIFARTHQQWDVVASDLPSYLAYREKPGAQG
jgi:hypothetical protein